MKIIQLYEQIQENSPLSSEHSEAILPYLEDGKGIAYPVKRGKENDFICLCLERRGQEIHATGSYYIGLDWLKKSEVAIQVNPKMNDHTEIDYVRMLNEALSETENFEHLENLVTIRFDAPSIPVSQAQDLLSLFLVIEYLNTLYKVVRKGLKKSYYQVEENLSNKVKGHILTNKTITKNLMRGHITNNVCTYQVYGLDSSENRILKKALHFCTAQLKLYSHTMTVAPLLSKINYIKPYFTAVGDTIATRIIQSYKGNPIYKEYNQAIHYAQLLLKRYSYNITAIGKEQIATPPFWIDMSKLFELYIYHHLRNIFTDKDEIRYHVKAHYQELDYLLKPELWNEPYVIDAKYKPRYIQTGGISKEDARQVAGYARLCKIYQRLGLDEEKALPIKCLIIYPDQQQAEQFNFTRHEEPTFDKVSGYVRMYKIGIRLPEINIP